MSSIINRIIEIDSIAQQRLNDAHIIENGIRQQIIDKNTQTNKIISEKAEARIAKIDEIEQQYSQEEMAKIKEDSDAHIAKLEQVYMDTHEKIELEIFNNVIGI